MMKMIKKMTARRKARMKKAREQAKQDRRVKVIENVGFIEDFYGNGNSFNVYKMDAEGNSTGFYASAYSMSKAEVLLDEIVQYKQRKHDENINKDQGRTED